MIPLRLRYIEVFLALMQTGSTQGAAQVLCTTQPSISKALGALERQLGFALFLRTGSRLKPTADAYTLMAEANRVNEEVRAFLQVAAELQEGHAVHLNVQTTPALASFLVPRVAARYKQSWQRAKLNLGVAGTDTVVTNVRKHLTDIGVVITSAEEHIGLVRKLWSAPMVCVFPKGHALSAKSEIHPEDLAGLPLVAYRSSLGLGKLVEKAFESAGLAQQIEIRVNNTAVICSIVDEGYGVAVVDRLSLAAKTYSNLESRPFLPECMMHIGLVISEQLPLSVQGERFVELLKQCLEELEPLP
jgi:DNA-binding transcriptional LysR family regulator